MVWHGRPPFIEFILFLIRYRTNSHKKKNNNNTYFVVCLLLLGVVVDTGLAAGHLGACQVNAVEL